MLFWTLMSIFNIFSIYHGQGNWLISSDYFSGSPLATESPCYIAGCESRQHLQVSDIFRETPRECINILKITKLESVGGRVNSQQWEGQWSTVSDQWSTVNSERVDSQQSTMRGSMVNSEAINDQHCWLLILGGDQQWEGQQWGDWWSTLDCWSWGGSSQQWEGQQSTVRWLMINTVDCWSWGINSQQWEGQQSTVRWSTINSQQWEGWWSTVRWLTTNSQQWEGPQPTVRQSTINTVDCWFRGINNWCREDKQSIALLVYHDASWVSIMGNPLSSTSKVQVHRFAKCVKSGIYQCIKGKRTG